MYAQHMFKADGFKMSEDTLVSDTSSGYSSPVLFAAKISLFGVSSLCAFPLTWHNSNYTVMLTLTISLTLTTDLYR